MRKKDRIIPREADRVRHPPNSQPWRTVREAIGDLPDPECHPRKSSGWLNHKFQPGARSYPGHTGSPLDEPAKTLKAGVHGVPGGENMLRRPDGSIRYLKVHACRPSLMTSCSMVLGQKPCASWATRYQLILPRLLPVMCAATSIR